jgi:hypothetical protein
MPRHIINPIIQKAMYTYQQTNRWPIVSHPALTSEPCEWTKLMTIAFAIQFVCFWSTCELVFFVYGHQSLLRRIDDCYDAKYPVVSHPIQYYPCMHHLNLPSYHEWLPASVQFMFPPTAQGRYWKKECMYAWLEFHSL